MNFLLLALSAVRVSAWGADGHMVVAQLAEALLEPATREYFLSVLDAPSLASVATWADQVDHTAAFAWSKCMHYVDSQDGVCGIDFPSDCHNGCCVVSAIHNYTDRASQAEPIKFLVHFFGDVHQPLHAGRQSDQGGNAIHVHWEGKATNLHAVWDSAILDLYLGKSQMSFTDYAEVLFSKIGDFNDFRKWVQTCLLEDCALVAAEESASAACEYAYVDEYDQPIVSGQRLSDQYLADRMLVVEARLAAAGVRLATVLNMIHQKVLVANEFITIVFQ